ncbi:transmembrane protein 43 [Sebastes umbrosus]|uniref:transmembrane protein 43 n=1 Tax=Sebastes umbrosus TaxID=72105 RepID=UPI00189CE1E0|nr:transmembrane protein 43 [Sebastes umbrosus]XP_037633622.1 transmembrane protein 43 [Sebastes umbrosus]
MSSAQTFSDPNQHKRVTVQSNPGFLERLSETAGGTVVGVGLFFLSFYVLFTNEGRALQTASSLHEGLSQVVSLEPFSNLDLQNNNRLVHLSTELRTSQPLVDPNYRVVVQAVKLKRQVEMYQWVEYRESKDYQEDGETKTETTYNYNTEWKSEVVNSRHFDKEIGHQNPSAMAVESVTVEAPEVRVGPFRLSKGLVEQIKDFQTLSLRDFSAFDVVPFLTIDDDYFYHTQTPRRPEVGDVRVRFSFAGLSGETSRLGPAQTVSVVAMQRGEQLMSFKTKSGDTLEILYPEELSAEEVFEKELQYNSMKTWGLRAAGWALMFLSIQLTMRIIYTLVDWVPILRELVSVGLKIFALCVSCSLSLLTIAVGWLFYRPLVAAALGALALVPVFLARSRLPAKKNE